MDLHLFHNLYATVTIQYIVQHSEFEKQSLILQYEYDYRAGIFQTSSVIQ